METRHAQRIAAVVSRARSRLSRDDTRVFVKARLEIVLGAAAACAVLRPWLWPLHTAAPYVAPLRAAALALLGALVASVVLGIVAWRRRPSLLAAARRLDGALGLPEVVASGFAFERDGRGDPMASLARARAERALDGVVLDVVLTPRVVASRPPTWSRSRVLSAVAVAIGVLVGTLDAALIDRALHPMTDREGRAADRLAHAADAAAPKDPKTEEEKTAAALAEAARHAAEAAQRGDRKTALAALDQMRAASRALDAEQREREKALRAVRDALDPARGSGAPGSDDAAQGSRAASSASEALQKMVDAMAKGADESQLRAMAARVARAESEASGHGTDPRFERAAAALREAREALARGDKAAAARALERAARELGAMENRSGSASERALSRLMSRAADLDRSLRAGMRGEKDGAGKGDKSGGKSGKSGKSGKGDQAEKGGKGDKGDKGAGSGAGDGDDDDDGEGDGDGDGKAKGGAKSGSGKQGAGQKQGGQPGVGPDGPGASMDHGGGPEAQRIRVTGNLTVRGDAREGERAVSAIQGMGQGGDGRAFREVFPSYDSAVEDGLRDELVPAARRPVVRRYFSSIRPGDAPAGTE